MNRIISIISVLFISCAALLANETNLFKSASELYKKGQFDTAVVIYKKLQTQGYESAQLFYNLGNAYYKQKMLPEAILNYERAKKLAPLDEDIDFNLQLAQSMVVDKINLLPEFFLKTWIRSITGIFDPDSWGILSIIMFILALVLTLIYLFTLKQTVKRVTFWLVCSFLVVSLLSALLGFSQKEVINDKTKAIVMQASVTLKSSPDEKGTDLFVIHEGLKVTITDEVGEWREIRIADGNKGWLRLADIEAI
jgi:tetratricopeptide (TPR) repeat protein